MMKENLQMVIVGLGGQGVILFTRILGEWALLEGCRVLATETHGMATRGGSVTAHVKLGDHHFPLIMKGIAQVALALAPTEEPRAKEYLAPGGLLVTNRRGRGEEKGVFPIPAGELALEELGSPLYANLVMLGAIGCKVLGASKESLLKAVKKVVGNRRLDKNARALELGYREADHVAT